MSRLVTRGVTFIVVAVWMLQCQGRITTDPRLENWSGDFHTTNSRQSEYRGFDDGADDVLNGMNDDRSDFCDNNDDNFSDYVDDRNTDDYVRLSVGYSGRLMMQQNTVFIDDKNKQVNHVKGIIESDLHLRQQPSPRHTCEILEGKYAYCGNRHLFEVPTDLPTSIISLILIHNQITRLPDNTLSKYFNLRVLDLSGNKIQSLSNYSFFGLDNLQRLKIAFNQLLYKKENFPDLVFSPLKQLTHLNISGNNPDPKDASLSYPDEALSKLKNLSSLQIDGLYKPVFGIGFKEMTSLRNLYINGYLSGYCNIGHLRNDTFEYLTGLTTLHLETCFIGGKYLDKRAFLPLTKLRDLSLKHNEDIGIFNLNSLFYGLQNATRLETLNLHLVVNRYSLGICLDSQFIQRMPKSIKYLRVQENNLAAVDRSVIGMLPPGLKDLELSGNHFVFGTYLKDLHKMKALESVKINGGSFRYRIPNIYPYDQPRGDALASEARETTQIKDSKCSLYNDPQGNNIYSKFFLTFPPNLKRIEMIDAGLTYTLSRWEVDPSNVVEYIFIGNNHFNLLIGPIIGFNKIKLLDISGSFVETIYGTFFDNLTSLESLNLQNNFLGRGWNKCNSVTPFSKLKNLKHLDLKFNTIHSLPENIFDGLDNLRYLYLDENEALSRFAVNLPHMKHLKYIGLRKTLLLSLPASVQSHVNTLIQSGITVRIDMSEAPILCKCRNLGFLKWMVKSGAFDERFNNYQCNYPDFTTQTLQHGYNETIRYLQKECTGHFNLFVAVAAIVSLIFIGVIGLVCYQCRWRLKFYYYTVQLYFKKDPQWNERQFEFDVFICFASEDQDTVTNVIEPELWKRNLRALVHTRDFPAGEYIASNIIKAVSRCKRTLVLVTQSMLDSKWCNYEIQMANVESRDRGREVLIFLLKGGTPRSDNIEVLYNIKRSTYCEFPNLERADEAFLQLFWDKLARDILSE